MPAGAVEKRELAVILNFHGGGGHGANEQEYSLMDRLADREAFLAVYPNGSGRFGKRLLSWNAGTCCGYAAINKIDDVGFARALIDKLAEVLPIDRRRIYATGLSNGGMMAHRLAAEAGDLIAAVVPVAGGMVLPAIKSARPVPVMHIHSVDDPRALYNGGLGPPFPLTKSRVFHPNIDRMIARWGETQWLLRAAVGRGSPKRQGGARPYGYTLRLSKLSRQRRRHALEAHRRGSCVAGRKTESLGAHSRPVH